MKTTFITTVLNEEKSIEELLEGLNFQSKLPDEVIIVDGGSTDATLSVISNFKFPLRLRSGRAISNKKIKIRILKKKGNRSIGRNEAIENATGDIIVCTDAGCILDKNWIKNITKEFENKNIDVVAGYYKPIANTVFEKCLAAYTSVMPDQLLPDDFLPSSRSIAFRKKAWEKAGKYPTWLDTCEDLYFARQLKRKGFKFAFAKNAIVYWPQRKNLPEALIQFFNYAVGDGVARYVRSNTPYLFGRYLIGLILIVILYRTRSLFVLLLMWVLLLNYIIWSIMKNYYRINDKRALFWLPILQFSADFAVIFGTILGLIKGLSIKRKS